MQLLRSLPVQLGLVIILVVFMGQWVPVWFAKGCYTFSIFFKELLSFILPFMVFFFVVAGILSFKRNAPLVLAILLGTIFCSNALVALLSYGALVLFSPVVSCEILAIVPAMVIEPFFTVSFPFSINAVHALIAAIILGLVFSFKSVELFESIVFKVKRWIEILLTYGFIPFLPIYILGFLLKIRFEGTLGCLAQQYGTAFLLIISLQLLYLLWFYLLANGFLLAPTMRAIKNALPSYITAFSTMSSTVAIPVSIKAAEQNTGNKELAQVAIPIMANIHLLGDSFVTPILALVTMLIFQGGLPGFVEYIVFVFYFCISMFAVSGIPGGGLLVMIPILKSVLGFSSEMVSVIMTLYFLLDAFGTGANVMGDGALVIIVNKLLRRLRLVQ